MAADAGVGLAAVEKTLDVQPPRRRMGFDVLRWALATCDAGHRVVLASSSPPRLRSRESGPQLFSLKGRRGGMVGGAGLEERVKAAMLDRLHAPGRPMGEVLTYGCTVGPRAARSWRWIRFARACGRCPLTC